MELVLTILILLVTTRLFGELTERARYPAMFGEIAAGVLLGPFILGIVYPNPELKGIADLGVFMLIFLAGLEMSLEEIGRALRESSVIIALTAFFFTFSAGFILAKIFYLNALTSIFFALCLALPALPVSIRILMDLEVIESLVGRTIVAAAIFSDIFGLMLLGIIIDIAEKSEAISLISIVTTLIKVLLFISLIIIVNKLVNLSAGRIRFSRKYLNIIIQNLKGQEPLFAITTVFVLLFAGIASYIGLHFIVGTFFGGLLVSRDIVGRDNFTKVKNVVSSISMGFLAPIFFAYIGLILSASFISQLMFAILTIMVAVSGAITGGFFGSRFAGFPDRDSLAIGIGLNSRGVMEIIIAEVALSKGIITSEIFSILVLMSVVTTLLTPPLLRRTMSNLPSVPAQSGIK